MAKRGGFQGGFPGNMNNLMKQAQRMQRQMEEKQAELDKQRAELEEASFEATAGGGAVRVVVSGKREISEVELQPEVVDPDDIEMLQDLIIAATNEALRKVDEAFGALGSIEDGLDLSAFKGMGGMGGLGGLF